MNTASRIVELQSLLTSAHLGNRERIRLVAEQRNLWDTEFPGAPYDQVARIARFDEWLVRK